MTAGFRLTFLISFLALGATFSAMAQDFPSKVIRIVSPHQAGGASELFARMLTTEMGELLGQHIMVEPKPGAAGTIGAREVAVSAPDGHTLLANASIQVMYPGMFTNLPFNPQKDFVPVGIFGSTPVVLAVNAQSKLRSFNDLIEAARASPGSVSFAHGGLGSLPHLVGELINQRTGVQMAQVAYNGTAPAVTDVVGGHVTVLVGASASAEPLIKSGKLRALAVTSATRMPSMPDVPTVAEEGIPDFDVTLWYALWAPAGTPAQVVAKINKAMRDASAMPAVQERMRSKGIAPSTLTAEAFAKFERDEGAKWLEVMQRAGLKPN